MEDKVLPLIALYLEDSQYIFQQDNCHVHKSAYSSVWFKRKYRNINLPIKITWYEYNRECIWLFKRLAIKRRKNLQFQR